jgi:FlaG/FlaF family flagellin (archaellin)
MARVQRRKGSLPPILVVLITMAAIVSAALVAWFMFTTTSSAVRQPVLEVTDAYYVAGNLFLTIRNIGSVDVTVSSISVTCQSGGTASYSGSTPIPKGAAQSIRASASGTIRDGDLCVAQVTLSSPSATSLTLSFKVVAP